jgi:hypothetical protein
MKHGHETLLPWHLLSVFFRNVEKEEEKFIGDLQPILHKTQERMNESSGSISRVNEEENKLSHAWPRDPQQKWIQTLDAKPCEAFLHTFHNKICTHKTQLGVELLCSCILTSKVVQCNVMKFIKNLLRCVHLEDTKKDYGKKSQLTMIEREGTLC